MGLLTEIKIKRKELRELVNAYSVRQVKYWKKLHGLAVKISSYNPQAAWSYNAQREQKRQEIMPNVLVKLDTGELVNSFNEPISLENALKLAAHPEYLDSRTYVAKLEMTIKSMSKPSKK